MGLLKRKMEDLVRHIEKRFLVAVLLIAALVAILVLLLVRK